MTVGTSATVVWFEDRECAAVAVAGGKGASLASLRAAGLPVPGGFVVTAAAMEETLREAGHLHEIVDILAGIRADADIEVAAKRLQELVLAAPIAGGPAQMIAAAYDRLDPGQGVAVRSSACAEDGEVASYAGQQETYLNVCGAEAVLEMVGRCWASFFGSRALFYRRQKGSLTDLGMAVVVQRQLDVDKAGVMFTIDPVRRRRDQMLIEGAWGLGEAVVSGAVIPDQYLVARDGKLKRARVAQQRMMVVRAPGGGTEEVELDPERGDRQVLEESELVALSRLGLAVEALFGGPQDVEWAFAGGELFLLQSRPVTA